MSGSKDSTPLLREQDKSIASKEIKYKLKSFSVDLFKVKGKEEKTTVKYQQMKNE